MAEVRWTPQAADDLRAIAEFISLDSFHYASILVMDVFAAVEQLAEFPFFGRIVPEIENTNIREIILGNYRIIYRVKETVVDILTIYHGAKLLDPSRLRL